MDNRFIPTQPTQPQGEISIPKNSLLTTKTTTATAMQPSDNSTVTKKQTMNNNSQKPKIIKEHICPDCGTDKTYFNGHAISEFNIQVQRYLCSVCGRRFSSQFDLILAKYVAENVLDIAVAHCLNADDSVNDYIRISAKQVKNLEPQHEKTIVVGDNTKIINHLEWMKNQGYQPSTIQRRKAILYGLQKLHADLSNPESVKATIANQNHWKASQKQVVVFAYDLYAKQYGYTWQRPWYEAVRELPFIPQEREIDDLIAGVHKEIGLLLLIAKETGARAGEIYNLLWTDIDFEARTLSIRAEKGSNPRRFTMSKKLQNILECYRKTTERIFNHHKNLSNLRRTFEKQRKRIAFKLCNPRLNQIKIHTLRHWKGTSEYEKTKDILHVMQTLGHKNIKNTLLYTQLVSVSEDKGYICKIAKTPADAAVLIEDGFEEHTSFDNGQTKLFRKRKT